MFYPALKTGIDGKAGFPFLSPFPPTGQDGTPTYLPSSYYIMTYEIDGQEN